MNKLSSIRFRRTDPRFKAADLERTIDFYTQTLGFHLCCVWPEDRPTFCLIERDDVRMAFDVGDTAGSTHDSTPSCGLYIVVEDVRALHEVIRERVPIEWGPEVYHYGCREFAINDPDGTMIIVTEPTDDPPTCHDE